MVVGSVDASDKPLVLRQSALRKDCQDFSTNLTPIFLSKSPSSTNQWKRGPAAIMAIGTSFSGALCVTDLRLCHSVHQTFHDVPFLPRKCFMRASTSPKTAANSRYSPHLSNSDSVSLISANSEARMILFRMKMKSWVTSHVHKSRLETYRNVKRAFVTSSGSRLSSFPFPHAFRESTSNLADLINTHRPQILSIILIIFKDSLL